MPDPNNAWLFFTASLALLLVPGPSVLYVSGRTIDLNIRGGVLSTLGLAVGDLVQVVAATVGVSALVASSEVAFEVVKYVGAAYLLWLGIRRLMTPATVTVATVTGEPVRSWRILTDGLVVNAFNPKSTLFFLAFLPAFVDSGRGAVWSQTLVLGLVFVAVGVLTNGGWAVLSFVVRDRAQRSRGFLSAQRWIGGGVLVLLAGLVVFTTSSPPAMSTPSALSPAGR